jgi:hypothetical protein
MIDVFKSQPVIILSALKRLGVHGPGESVELQIDSFLQESMREGFEEMFVNSLVADTTGRTNKKKTDGCVGGMAHASREVSDFDPTFHEEVERIREEHAFWGPSSATRMRIAGNEENASTGSIYISSPEALQRLDCFDDPAGGLV